MRIRNKIIASTVLLLVAIGGISCKKYLDINNNPLSAKAVEPKLLFGYAVTAWDVSKNSGDNYLAIGFVGQNLSTGGDFSENWGSSNLYDLAPNFLNNGWKVYYSTAGFNLKQAIKFAESAKPVNNNAAAQCKIVLAQILYEATTLFGDVPFTQAYDIDQFPYPKFDTQKDVFESLIKLLDEANAQIDLASTEKISDYDVFYNGNMTQWKKLATSIKFKILMTMVDKDPSKAAVIGTLVQAPGSMISSVSDNFRILYSGATNNENPKYRLFQEDNPFTYASKVVTDVMIPKNDPRLPKFFDRPDGETEFIGVAANVDADEHTSLLGKYLRRKDAPSLIFSYQEMLFFQAEVYARGLGVGKNLVTAQALYKKALQTSMEFYEADATDINNYMKAPANGGHLVDLTAAGIDPVKEIHTEQWIDLMDRSLEAFTQWRRSGPDGQEVPVLTVPFGATAGPLLRRFTLSTDEIAANPNIPSPLPRYYDKMWFDL